MVESSGPGILVESESWRSDVSWQICCLVNVEAVPGASLNKPVLLSAAMPTRSLGLGASGTVLER